MSWLEYLDNVRRVIEYYKKRKLNLKNEEDIYYLMNFTEALTLYVEKSAQGFRQWLQQNPYAYLLSRNRRDLLKIYKLFLKVADQLEKLDREITEKYTNLINQLNEKETERFKKLMQERETPQAI